MSVTGDPGYRRFLGKFKGGMMYYLGCHMIDMVVHFCGFPEEVIPMNTCTGIDADTKDYGFCVLRYKNGLSFVKTCAAEVNGAARRSLIISGTEGSFEIQPIELPRGDGWDDTIARETIGVEAGFDHSRPVVFPPHLRYDWLFRNFAKYVRGEAVNPYTYEYEAKLHDLILLACS